MLVVTGIISLLLAVLFPVLASARVKADSISCASRLRQLYTCTIHFANDHNMRLPRPTQVGETARNNPSPDYHQKCCWMQDPSAVAGKISFDVGGLWRYIGDPAACAAAVTCPADRDEPARFLGKPYPRNFSYSYNANLRVDDGRNMPVLVSLASVRHAPEKILLYEEIGPSDASCLSHGNAEDYPTARHGTSAAQVTGRENVGAAYFYGGRGNHCFFDGHVESLAPVWVLNPANYKSWGRLED